MKKNLIARLLDLDSLASLSRRAEGFPLQDPFRIRARYLGWKAASFVLDEFGEVKVASLKELIQALEESLYPVGHHEGDAWIFHHLHSILSELSQNPKMEKALKKCSLPLCSKEAEEIVRDTLWPDEVGPLVHGHVRRAVLSASLTLLRQATGSCFATAPAILIQRQDPLRLIRDLDALLSTGELRRGSYAAPLHSGSGLGDLQKQAALSPGLQAAFRAAGVPVPAVFPRGASVKRLLEDTLLSHFNLTREDLSKETVSLTPQFGVLWERLGGHYTGASPRTKQIHSWEDALERAKRTFLAVADCALLRSWEYTLASFADVKVEFARWNLFVSLGLRTDASPPGIGTGLLRIVQEKLDAANNGIAEMGVEVQRAVQAIRMTERLLQNALSEPERSKLKAELLSGVHVADTLSAKIEEERKRARFFSQFYAEFLKEAVEKLQLSFQEVFDPSLGEEKEELFEDSKAGFRLLYKSGRSAAASWDRIEDEAGFVNAVYKFFESIESQLTYEPSMQSCFTLIVTELLQYIRSEEFIAAALERAKKNKSAKNALPWAYESGGTMQTLLQSYYEWPRPQEEFARKIATPLELHTFLREAAKRSAQERHLMLSPTHAFLFYPRWLGPEDALEKSRRFVKNLALTPLQIEFLFDRFAETLPQELRSQLYFDVRKHKTPESLSALRLQLLSFARLEKVDGFLYEALPLFSAEEAGRALARIASRLGIRFSFKEPDREFLLSRDLVWMMKRQMMQEIGSFSSRDWDSELISALREEGLIYPAPILFADTNWSDWSFGLIRNAATEEVELWRLTRTGAVGMPMSEWKSIFFENSRWSVFL